MKNIFLVDMDETLLNFPAAERINLSRTLSAFGIEANDALLDRFHLINDGLWKKLERGETTRKRLVVERFEILFSEYGIPADAQDVANAYFQGFQEVCIPYDGAIAFLRELNSRGRVFIVTNGSAVIQRRHIADAGFAPLIEDAFISEEIGYNKPSLEFADYVESSIEGYERDRAVWIGDSLTSDGKCAENRGIEFIMFAPQGAPKEYRGKFAATYEDILRML